MNKILLSMAAVGAIAVAAPAASQNWSNAGGGMGISNRIAQLDARLSAAIQSGEINRTEARSLRMQVRQLQRLEQQYSYNGLTSRSARTSAAPAHAAPGTSASPTTAASTRHRYSWDDARQ